MILCVLYMILCILCILYTFMVLHHIAKSCYECMLACLGAAFELKLYCLLRWCCIYDMYLYRILHNLLFNLIDYHFVASNDLYV